MSIETRLIVGILIAIAAAVGWHKLTSHYDQQGYERAKDEDKAAAEEQATRNRELQRAAELHYIVKAEGRDRFFVTTVREIHDAAAPLADCLLPDAVRMRLNAAAACARGDSPASCGAAGEVPDAR